MAKKYECIGQALVGSGGASTIDFNNIPQTYTDLKIEISARGTGYNASDLYIKLNGATSGYAGKYTMKDSSDPTIVSSISQTSKMILGFIPATQATASAFGSATVYLPNYSATNRYKLITSEGGTENNGNIQWIVFAGGLWSSNAAITSVTLLLNTDSFVQNSTAYLYGIKNS